MRLHVGGDSRRQDRDRELQGQAQQGEAEGDHYQGSHPGDHVNRTGIEVHPFCPVDERGRHLRDQAEGDRFGEARADRGERECRYQATALAE